jgi:hypothetical protein
MTMEVKSKILCSPPSLSSLQSILSSQLSTHRHGHVAKDMLHDNTYCRLDMIKFLGLVAKRMIARTIFRGQAFEATETQEISKALT